MAHPLRRQHPAHPPGRSQIHGAAGPGFSYPPSARLALAGASRANTPAIMRAVVALDRMTPYHCLDALRGGAMLLGVVYHAAIPFTISVGVGSSGDLRAFTDRSQHVLFDLLAFVLHAFRMPLFFLLAGFFAHLLACRLGRPEFIANRCRRVALPLLIGMVTVVPLAQAAEAYGSATRSSTHWSDPVRAMVDYFLTGTWMSAASQPLHLWFLTYLLVLYAATILLLASGDAFSPGLRRTLATWFRRGLSSWAGPFALGLATVPVTLPYWGTTQGLSILPTPSVLGYHAAFYLFGWLLWDHRDLLDCLERRGPVYLTIALVVIFPLLVLVSWTGAWLAMVGLYGLLTWLIIYGLLGLSLRLLNQPSRAVRYLVDASYWIYLAHFPLVMFLNALIAQWPVSALVKYPGVVLASLSMLLLSYELGVRQTAIGRVLNGGARRAVGSPRQA